LSGLNRASCSVLIYPCSGLIFPLSVLFVVLTYYGIVNYWFTKPNIIMYHKKLWTVLLGAGMLFTVSCKKSDPPASPVLTFTALLTGSNEVPINTSTATGSATVFFNNDTKILTLTANYTGMTATNAHIHNAAAGTNGPVVFPLGTAPFSSPISFTSTALTATQETDLKANNYYVNIHSAAFPGGEIRGQLIRQ
jgi:hypothetical protein